MNLLQETREAITASGHAENDIVFIGSEVTGHQCSWQAYCTLANIEYNSGFGAAEVATDLVIVFSDGQKLWRGEYDGSEWWEHSTPFVKPEQSLPITRLTGGLWASLAVLNKGSNVKLRGAPLLARPSRTQC